MDIRDKLREQISDISRKIEGAPDNYELHLERGRLYHKAGDFNHSLNDFIRAGELDPGNKEAEAYIAMLNEIFAFRYKDLYNP